MNLPQISTLNTTQDPNKQLAQMKSYLVQFKDETEAELNNVGYEMLSSSLQKRIDKINDDIAANNSYTQLVAETLSARYITADAIQAQYATVGQLSAQIASVKSLFADYATVGNLNAVAARVGSIEANYITANYVDAKTFSADHIYAGTINGNYVQWQKIYCISQFSWGYLFQNAQGKLIFTTEDRAPDPSYTKLCGFMAGATGKSFFTLAKDNA